MPDYSTDGYCAAPGPYVDGIRVWCRYEVGHAGPHSWTKLADRLVFHIRAGITGEEVLEKAARGDHLALVYFRTHRETPEYCLFVAAVAAALQAMHHPFAVVDGVAAEGDTAHVTNAVDFAVGADDDADVQSILDALRAQGFEARIAERSKGRMSAAQLDWGDDDVRLLFASTGIEREIVNDARDAEVTGVGRLRLARVEDLLAVKIVRIAATRPRDRADAHVLLMQNPELRLGDVSERLALITSRGFHREQDLAAKLQFLLRDRKPA